MYVRDADGEGNESKWFEKRKKVIKIKSKDVSQ